MATISANRSTQTGLAFAIARDLAQQRFAAIAHNVIFIPVCHQGGTIKSFPQKRESRKFMDSGSRFACQE
jgi:hypothetical protein